MNYLDRPRLAKLTGEIHFFNEQGIKVSIEVGKRLEEAKEEFSSSDQWMIWAESEFGYKKSQAYKLVSIAKRFHSSGNLLEGKTINEVYALAAFNDEELEATVQLPSGDTKKPIDMSAAEIERYKKALQEAERNAEQSKQQMERYSKELRERPVIEKPTSMPQDKAHIQALEKRLENAEHEAEVFRKKANLNEEEAKKFAEMKKQISFLNQEKSDLHRQIESATALSGLAVKIQNFLKTELAPIRYSRALERLDSEVAVRNLTEIILAVEHWCEDIRKHLPEQNRIIVEVSYDSAS